MDFLTQATLIGAGAVTLAHQFLKLKIIPLAFANRYPVPANIILSIVCAAVVVPLAGIELAWANWAVIVRTFGLVAVGAAIAYNQLLSKWPQLKASEGDGKSRTLALK